MISFFSLSQIDGKPGNFGNKLSVTREKPNKIIVTALPPFSKRYLKYLTKKFLKKQGLREWLRVVAIDKQSYELKYFNIQQDEADEE